MASAAAPAIDNDTISAGALRERDLAWDMCGVDQPFITIGDRRATRCGGAGRRRIGVARLRRL
jgi:hypothetical protein